MLAVVSAGAAQAQPDVVLVVADDLGFGEVGYNGSEVATPNIDALAAEGVVLDRFYVASRCSPSRAGLLTGRYPARMRISEAIGRADTVGLPLAEVTLAEVLQTAGYETAMVGKWHLGDACHQHPSRHGFGSFVGMTGGGADYFTRGAGAGMDWWRGRDPAPTEGYTTDLIADEAVEVLSRPRDGPLFLYLPFSAPHMPAHAREEDLARYAHLAEPFRTRAAMVARLDHAVGRIMDAVRASDRAGDTVVWFLSDNGGQLDEGGVNRPLRGEKGQAYEGGIRVPAVVWYPRWGARRVGHPVWYLDVLPTLAGVADAPAWDGPPLDGTDQRSQLRGAPPPPSLLDRVLYTYSRIGADGEWLAAQNADWKLLMRPGSDGIPDRLIHLALDPAERTDSLDAYPERAAALREGALAYAARTLPGASRDDTLVEEQLPDYSACGGQASLPRPPGIRDGGRVSLPLVGLLLGLLAVFGVVALRVRG